MNNYAAYLGRVYTNGLHEFARWFFISQGSEIRRVPKGTQE